MDRCARFLGVVVLLACGERSSLDDGSGVGDAGTGAATVTPASVDFGLVPCGKIASARVVNVFNQGTAAFSFEASLALGDGSPYQIAPTKDIVAPGGTVPVVIWPSPLSPTADVSPNFYGDTLTVTTDVPNDTPHIVAIDETAHGAILSMTSMVPFGKQVVGTTPIMPVAITNSGNLDATAKLAATEPFAFVTASVTVAAHSTTSVGVRFAPDASNLDAAVGTVVTLTTDADVCGSLPAVVINGTAIESAKALGGAFGPTMCAVGAVSGNLYCWGATPGNGTSIGSNKPVLSQATNVVEIAGGWLTVCGRRIDGTVQCWGGDAGVLGNGTTNTSNSPVAVTGLTDAKQLVRGVNALCAIRQTGNIVCWGYNSYGQFGNGFATPIYYPSLTPVTVFGGIADVVDAAMNAATLCVVRSGGSVQCAGSANGGMFGTGSTFQPNSYTPVTVPGITTATKIAISYYNVCVIVGSGDVECWGNGYYGNNGNGSNAVAWAPVYVSGLHDAVAISGGYNYMCAVRSTGEVACWGDNYYGTLGDTTYTSSNVPVSVFNVSMAVDVVAGDDTACVRLSNGTLWCWGSGLSGELGNGSNTTVAYPVSVNGFD